MITIHFFAGLTRTFSQPLQWELKQEITVKELISQLQNKFEEASELLAKSRAAINEEFVDLSAIIKDQTEVFIIPPSSGG